MRALIIDDQPLIVCGLQAVMGSLHASLAVSCAESAQAARQMLTSELHFDLVLLDLELEGSGGIDFLAELRETHPSISIVVLSASNANELVSRAIFMGAMGFVPKRASNATLIEALQLVISGIVYVPPMRLRSTCLLESPETSRDHAPVSPLANVPDVGSSATRRFAAARRLTPRQTDVLELLLLGQSNKLIARALSLSVDTVKEHVTSLLRILNVTSRTQAVLAINQLSDRARLATDAVPSRSVSKHFTEEGRFLAALGKTTSS